MNTDANIRQADALQAAILCNTLTQLERDVLVLSAKGFGSREVGALLGKNYKTVDRYRSDIMAKLDVGSTIEAAVIAAKAGLV
jgi:DNA-binding NarL/FixJ family response regulator